MLRFLCTKFVMGGFGYRCEIWVHWYTNLIVYIFFEAGFVQTLGAAESFGQMLDFAKSELFQQKEKYRPTPGGGEFWS